MKFTRVITLVSLIGASLSASAAQSVDILITRGHILSMDSTLTEYESGFVAVKDGRIVAVGPQEKASDYRAGTLLDVDGDLARRRPESRPTNAHDVTDVDHLLEELVVVAFG